MRRFNGFEKLMVAMSWRSQAKVEITENTNIRLQRRASPQSYRRGTGVQFRRCTFHVLLRSDSAT